MTFRVPWKQSKIKFLEGKLEQMQKQVELFIIADVRELYNAAFSENTQFVRSLRQDQRSILEKIAQNSSDIQVSVSSFLTMAILQA